MRPIGTKAEIEAHYAARRARILELWPTTSARDIGAELGMTPESVIYVAVKAGLPSRKVSLTPGGSEP